MNLSDTGLAVNAALDAQIPPMLWGAPGIGKSELVAAIAADRGADLRDIRLSMFDPVDLRGLPAIVGGLTQWIRPAIWPTDDTRETVLFFDEIDRAAPAVMSAAMQIVLDRRVGEHVLPDSVRVIAAGNGRTDRTGTNKMPSALANRFCHLDVTADSETWARWAAGAGVDPAIVAFVRFRPALLIGEAAPTDRTFPSPRAWVRAGRLMNLPDHIRHALIAGLVSAGPAAEFEAFVRVMRQLPSLDSILADPAGAPVPSDPSARYAVSAALSRRATIQNFAAVLEYARRLPREFEINCAVDAVKRTPTLTGTRAFVAWAVRNQDVTI